MTKIAFTDVESTGLDPHVHEPWELAVIVREPGTFDTERVWQLRPNLDVADPKALEVGRFRERFVVPEGWDAAEILPSGGQVRLRRHEALHDIQDALRDAYLVGAIPGFDAGMLAALLRRHGRRIVWHHRVVCVESMACAALGRPVPEGLRAAAEALGVQVDEQDLHTALADARLARDVYDAALARTEQERLMREYVAAAVEALDIPHAASMGNEEVRDGILLRRAMLLLVALQNGLEQPHADVLRWNLDHLRERLAEHPPAGYVTAEQAQDALEQGASWMQAVSPDQAGRAEQNPLGR